MPMFGKASLNHLLQLHPSLQEILLEAIEIMDFSIVCSYRGEKAQNAAFAAGKSKKKFPFSKHNMRPSPAVDLCPYREGLKWNDKEAFYLLGGILKAIAYKQGKKIRLGLDWDGDNDVHDQTFNDLGHAELLMEV